MDININTIVGIANVVLTITWIVVAIWGVNQWKTEMRDKTRFEWARHFVLLASEFDLQFAVARSSRGPSYDEYKDRIKGNNESDDEAKQLDYQYAHLGRLDRLKSIMQKMTALNWEAEILVEKDFKSFIDVYTEAWNEVRIAIIAYHNPRREQYQRAGSYTLERINKWHEIIYGIDETLTEKVTQNTLELKSVLKEYVSLEQPHKHLKLPRLGRRLR